MKILDVIQTRRSVRRFSEKKVDRKIIQTCLEAAHLAPSAENSQPWRFVILDDQETIKAFGASVFTGIYKTTQWAIKAPVLIALCSDLDFLANRMGRLFQGIPFYLLDVGIAGEHLVLQAAELGLGSCWIGWFNVKQAKKRLNLPRPIRICSLLALGYPAENWAPKPHKRKDIDLIIHWNGW